MTPNDRRAELVRVILVSPGDVAEEREAVKHIIDDLNRRVAPSHSCQLSLWRWETDARPGLHLQGPQGLIDERMEIAGADVVIGIFWKRFGTPIAGGGSGAEHELRRAWEAWRRNGRPDVMVYFCQRPWFPADAAEADQLHRVMTFRDELPEEQLWWNYTQTVEFERLIRAHLEDVVLRRAASGYAEEAHLVRVFLCHSSQDKEIVRELHQRLRQDGFDPWLDEEDLLPGQDWDWAIRKAIREADAVAICLSRSSTTKAGYVQKEIKFALDVADEQPQGAIFLIPARLEDCEVPDRLSRLHWVDLFTDLGYRRLVRALNVSRTSGRSF